VAACLAACAVVLLAGERRLIPRAAWMMALAGVGLWWLARLVLFDLYLPNRHSRMALGVFFCVVLSAAGFAVMKSLVRRVPQEKRAKAWRGAQLSLALLAPLVVTVSLTPHAVRAWTAPRSVDLEQVYAFLGELPVDTLVAAHPDLADYIPLRSRRSVLASTEMSIAFMTGYYSRVKPRIETSLRAAYATSLEEMDSALAPYGVDVFVTGPQVWAQTSYVAPFEGLASELIARGDTHGFVLQSPPADRVLFKSGEYYVVRVNRSADVRSGP
jgi:hypothetical protein